MRVRAIKDNLIFIPKRHSCRKLIFSNIVRNLINTKLLPILANLLKQPLQLGRIS